MISAKAWNWGPTIKARLKALLNRQVMLNQAQLVNSLAHIEKLVDDKQTSNLSP